MNQLNRIFNRINAIQIHIASQLSSFIVKYIICYIKGVKIGHKNKFYGFPYIYLNSNGNIQIGSNNTFNSSKTYNKLGINHACMISCTPINNKGKITIGDNCGFSGTTIRCFVEIKIGNNVRCGANTIIMDGDEHFNDKRTSSPKSIIIEDNVFLGAGVVVRKGVKIGKNSVIGMNSMVTHDVPENVVAVGSPCKIIKKFDI